MATCCFYCAYISAVLELIQAEQLRVAEEFAFDLLVWFPLCSDKGAGAGCGGCKGADIIFPSILMEKYFLLCYIKHRCLFVYCEKRLQL